MSETPPADLPVRETVLLAAFEGWNDAGSAATQALEHLHEVWGAEQVDELDPEEYHDFQVNRPVVGPGPDGRREITWPTTAVAVATAPVSGRRVVLVHGIEPSMRWRRYCTELLDIAAGLGVDTVVTVGALLADVPHTRPIPVNATSEDAGVRDVFGLEPNTYEGPTGIVGVLQHEAAARGLRSMSLWAAVPHYVAHPPSPKATLAILHRLEQLLGEPVPLGECPTTRPPGSTAWTSWPRRTPRSPSTCTSSRRPRTRPTCPRRAARRSRRSSSATCAGATRAPAAS